MRKSDLVITLDIPALDRLLDYLEAEPQSQIDGLAAQVVSLTSELQTHRQALKNAITKENTDNNAS